MTRFGSASLPRAGAKAIRREISNGLCRTPKWAGATVLSCERCTCPSNRRNRLSGQRHAIAPLWDADEAKRLCKKQWMTQMNSSIVLPIENSRSCVGKRLHDIVFPTWNSRSCAGKWPHNNKLWFCSRECNTLKGITWYGFARGNLLPFKGIA